MDDRNGRRRDRRVPLIGILAARVALGRSRATTDTVGALARIARLPFGRIPLAAIVLGFGGYTAWRFC